MPIVIDLIMIALLIGVIMHSIHLSQSLKNFQHLHGEIKPMLKEHTQSLLNSGRYVEQLRSLIRDVNQTLQNKTPEVQLIKQDLEFMTNRANQIADYLEKLLQEARLSGVTHHYLARETDLIKEPELMKESGKESLSDEIAATPLVKSSNADKLNQEAALATTKTSAMKQLRQKIKATGGKVAGKTQLSSKNHRQETHAQSTLTQKFVEKIRGKNHAA